MSMLGLGISVTVGSVLLLTGLSMKTNDSRSRDEVVIASSPEATVEIGVAACVQVLPLPHQPQASTVKVLVLRQLHATSNASGPFAVYLETAGSTVHEAANRVGYFSLYSVALREDAQDFSFTLTPKLTSRLLAPRKTTVALQVCVENRNPDRGSTATTVATFRQALVIAAPAE